MSKEQVLMLLHQSGNQYISGEQISTQLGVSRAAVWKDIEALRQEGYRIDSAPRRGYRLTESPNRLSAGDILPWLNRRDGGARLIVLDSVDSTNTYAKRLGLENAPDGTVIVANHQTGGRGRLGRSFLSPPDKGIYISMLFRPELPPARAVNLTSYVAVAICDAIRCVCNAQPGIKWTNDIVLGNRKLAGILTEMSVEGETGALQYLVTGIGINVLQEQEDFPKDLHPVATSLRIEGHPVSRGQLAAQVINALDTMYQSWQNGTGDYWSRYKDSCLTLGKEVCILRGGKQQIAFAEALDPDFGLVVRNPDGTRQVITAGEVSVRGLYGYV